MLSREVLAVNFARIEERIAAACTRAGRARESVRLIAVSKLHPPEVIRLAYALGFRQFGENYAQELRDKHLALSDCAGLRWHAIGPVQPKNAKYIAKAAHVFHALERFEVAQELSKRRTGTALDCLIEVNVANEASKAGITVDEAAAFAERIAALPGLRLVGLTTMPPLGEDPRGHFKTLAKLGQSLGLTELSMGTTDDFEAAIEEGATFVRIGTALFGPREVVNSL